MNIKNIFASVLFLLCAASDMQGAAQAPQEAERFSLITQNLIGQVPELYEPWIRSWAIGLGNPEFRSEGLNDFLISFGDRKSEIIRYLQSTSLNNRALILFFILNQNLLRGSNSAIESKINLAQQFLQSHQSAGGVYADAVAAQRKSKQYVAHMRSAYDALDGAGAKTLGQIYEKLSFKELDAVVRENDEKLETLNAEIQRRARAQEPEPVEQPDAPAQPEQ